MENLFYNLSEEEFTKGRKILLWIFATMFFLAGTWVLFASFVLGQKNIPPILSTAPYAVCLIISTFAAFATIKRKDLFFLVNDEKIEFRYGILRPKQHSFKWLDIKEIVMPHKQKKVKLIMNDGSSFVIDLTWLQKKKTSIIRKHIYHAARGRNMNVSKVNTLPIVK